MGKLEHETIIGSGQQDSREAKNISYQQMCKNAYQTQQGTEDEYTGEGVGVGQDLTEREKFFRTLEGLVIRPTARLRFPHLTRRRIGLTVVGDGKTSLFKRSAGRGRTNTYQISCSKADARWDGSKADRPTDTSTWAPELRREIRAGGRHEGGLKAEDAR
ncbi:hypothetical protein TIFTF001_034556 [Ficus carica]|uniref:Uncharacterized protein n=1 Tax=Ficus carica TaxID=3494 RepID=A0AA88E0D7_FICCA|nr:hypothetical protein TIFTF001_034535 [Ficus carica]GMN65482.1 hypothetical protein TIFTF001_034556 [Ficus carica]